MTLGELMAEYRRQHSLSQRRFAQLCNVSNGYISMLEKGTNPATGGKITPSIPLLAKVAKQMGLTLDELLSKAEDIEVDLSTAEETVTEYIPTHKETAYFWARNEATANERLEFAKELLNML